MASAPSNSMQAKTPCNNCCQLSQTAFDSEHGSGSELWGCEIWSSDMSLSASPRRAYLPTAMLSVSCAGDAGKAESREGLSSRARRGFATVRKMMSKRYLTVLEGLVEQELVGKSGKLSWSHSASALNVHPSKV